MPSAGSPTLPASAVRPPRSAATRERILGAARRELRGGELPTLSVVAREAGLSRATLYRLIPSRGELLRLLEVEPDPSARERVLSEALSLLGEQGLSRLSMDDLAARAGVSRASLYRLFPGKAALFRDLVRAHAPFLPLARALAEHVEEPPELVMPRLAQVAVANVEPRLGLFRTLFFEISGGGLDAELARELALSETIGPLAAYLAAQMELGRLRPMSPLVALLAYVGPLVMHLMTRQMARRSLGLEVPLEVVADELAATWLRAMAPDPEAHR